MLPPHLASFCFVDPESGSDDALAARTAEAVPGGRVMLLGASRPGLVRALAARGLELVVVDSSRTALRRAREELRDGPEALLLAADPRELEIPGGVDAMLVPSAPWRAVLLATDRRHVLRAMSRELRAGGLLLLELEHLPPPPEEWAPLPSAAPDIRWRRDRVDGVAVVRGGSDDVAFALFEPDEAVSEALDEGFEARATATSSGDGRVAVWAVLRTTRGAR